MKRLDFYNHDAFFWTLVLLFYTSAVLLYTVKIYSGAIFFLILGTILILSLFNKSDSLLKIEVNNSQITFFHTENKKKCSRTFSFNELKSFILEISHMVNYNKSPFSKSREPVNLSFKVTNTQDELFVYNVILPSFLNIAKVFDILKNIPNFKYQVITNSDSFGALIDRCSQSGKDIYNKQYLDIMFKDPKVPQSNKDLIKLAIIAFKIQMIILAVVTIVLVANTIKMFVPN